jgi:hypothetical protein
VIEPRPCRHFGFCAASTTGTVKFADPPSGGENFIELKLDTTHCVNAGEASLDAGEALITSPPSPTLTETRIVPPALGSLARALS